MLRWLIKLVSRRNAEQEQHDYLPYMTSSDPEEIERLNRMVREAAEELGGEIIEGQSAEDANQVFAEMYQPPPGRSRSPEKKPSELKRIIGTAGGKKPPVVSHTNFSRITIGERTCEMPFIIEAAVSLSGLAIVVSSEIEISETDPKYRRNVVALDTSGKIVWRIEKRWGQYEIFEDLMGDDPYHGLEKSSDGGSVNAVSWSGDIYPLDSESEFRNLIERHRDESEPAIQFRQFSRLTINDLSLEFDTKIISTVPVGSGAIVLFDAYDCEEADQNYERNVFALDKRGEILWRIERSWGEREILSDGTVIRNPYRWIELSEKKDSIQADTWRSMRYDLDPETGKISNPQFYK